MKQSRSVIGLLNIVITNIVVLNGGDGAILFGMIRSLRCAFGDDCRIIVYASEPAAAKRMYPEIEFRETLGLKAIILKGVTIVDNSVIAAGAVVTRNVPPNTLVGGVPSRVIKRNIMWG